METDIYSEDAALLGERQAAARALLAAPLLTERTHPAEFPLVRANEEWLVQRFQRVLGYRLEVADDHARLVKRGSAPRSARHFTRTTGVAFTPRTHTYFALTLAVLVEEHGHLTLRSLAHRVRSAAQEAGVDADPARGLGERRAFCAALRRLCELGALSETSGSIADHQADPGSDPHLFVHTQTARSVAVHLPRGDDDAGSFLAASHDTDPDGDQQGEVALRRLLAENAVVYREELSGRQRDRLASHQWRAAAALGNLLGCDMEVRAEGVALVMSDEAGVSPRFPGDDPVGQVALSLVRRLSGRLDPGRPATSVPVPDGELDTALEALGGEEAPVRAEWTRTAGPEIPDHARLRERVLALLTDFGLLSGGPGAWRLTAAAARYGAEVDERVPPVRDNDQHSRTHPDPAHVSGDDPEPEASADPHGDLRRVASVLQAVANEKVSATSGDTGNQPGPGGGEDGGSD